MNAQQRRAQAFQSLTRERDEALAALAKEHEKRKSLVEALEYYANGIDPSRAYYALEKVKENK